MKKKILGILLVLGMVTLLAGGSPMGVMAEELTPTTMTWVAGGVGGGWYAQAGGLARLITEKEPKIILKVVPGGGVVNPVRISRGKDGLLRRADLVHPREGLLPHAHAAHAWLPRRIDQPRGVRLPGAGHPGPWRVRRGVDTR